MEKNLLQHELERIRSEREVLDLIDTNFHRNGFRFPREPIADAMDRYLRGHSYDPDPRGSAAAREAISAYYAGQGARVSPDRLILTASSSESYNLLFNNFTAPGDNILLPRPTYPLFEYLAGFNHLEVRYYDLDPGRDFRIDVESVVKAIDSKTRFLVVISPNNPTGRVAVEEEISALVDVAADGGLMIICDEVFSEFLYDGTQLVRPMQAAEGHPRAPLIFTLNGISKMFALPDLKLSWIAATGDAPAAGEALERLEVANDMFLNCNSFTQFLLPSLFETGTDFRRSMIARIDTNRRLLIERFAALPGVRLTPPNGGIHATVELSVLPDGWDDERFAVELLRRAAVYLHPGYLYGIESGAFVVLSFLREHESFVAGLDACAAAVGEFALS